MATSTLLEHVTPGGVWKSDQIGVNHNNPGCSMHFKDVPMSEAQPFTELGWNKCITCANISSSRVGD